MLGLAMRISTVMGRLFYKMNVSYPSIPANTSTPHIVACLKLITVQDFSQT